MPKIWAFFCKLNSKIIFNIDEINCVNYVSLTDCIVANFGFKQISSEVNFASKEKVKRLEIKDYSALSAREEMELIKKIINLKTILRKSRF